MAIPAILKGDTSGSIVLDIKAGYEYEGCTLAVVFNGVRKEFTGLVSGGAKSLQYTADETAGMPLGTAHATMTLTNAAGVVRSMPWVRIRVTDIPAEIYDRHIDVDPSQLDVEPAKAGDSLGEVKAKLNAVMAFLRGGAACLLACVGLASFGDIGPTTPLNDVPGDTTISNLVVKSGVSTGTVETDNALVLTNGSVKTKSGTEITPSDMGAAAAGDVEKLNIGYTRLYNFSLGSTNANFTATNYPPTKAEADARCHFEAEPGMDFSKVPASLQLNEYRDGERRTVVDTRDWTVWYFKFKERQLTNEIARLRAENVVLSNKVEAAKSWADRTANGVDNPMTDTVVVDRPNLWLMADYEWQKVVSGSNQCFVLRAKNVALSGGANTNGFLEVCDAFGKPYMRINKSSEMFADPVFDEIYWDQAEGAWYVVFANSAKPTKGGANVALRGGGDGKCIFFEEADPECPAVITWPDVPESHSGHWIMKAVPKPIDGIVPTTMFFAAEIKVPGSDYVEYLKEASFGAGVRFGNNVYDYVESGDQLILRKRQ